MRGSSMVARLLLSDGGDTVGGGSVYTASRHYLWRKRTDTDL